MNKTKIDWCDMSWNPITGCLHGCDYCYANRIATRFSNWGFGTENRPVADGKTTIGGLLHVLDKPYKNEGRTEPYPFKFEPTFHKYRLEEPANKTKGKTIFVCSMADLFGDWVPDEWVEEVFKACEKAPQHRYLFLTKNPKRLCDLANKQMLPQQDNFWYGTTVVDKNSMRFPGGLHYNTFLSIEPIQSSLDAGLASFGGDGWIIVGAETGNRKMKVIPKREWIENIVEVASITQIPVFMKESLRDLMGADFTQEFPW